MLGQAVEEFFQRLQAAGRGADAGHEGRHVIAAGRAPRRGISFDGLGPGAVDCRRLIHLQLLGIPSDGQQTSDQPARTVTTWDSNAWRVTPWCLPWTGRNPPVSTPAKSNRHRKIVRLGARL